MKIWKKVTALVLSLAMTLSASATVLAQAPSIKEGHVTTTASVTNDGIYINGKYYTKVQFKHLLNKAQKTFNHMILVMQAHSLLEHGGFPELVR